MSVGFVLYWYFQLHKESEYFYHYWILQISIYRNYMNSI